MQQFRSRDLRGELVPWADVETWITRRTAKAGERRIAWIAPDAEGVRRAPIRPGSSLDRLRALSESLSNSYGWQEAQATAFVLCDVIPLIPAVRVTVRRRWPLTGTSRVLLDADPAANPREVEAAFRKARRDLAGDRERFRDPDARSLRLAAFTAEGTAPTATLLREWNRANPDGQYQTIEAFERAVRRVRSQLLEPY